MVVIAHLGPREWVGAGFYAVFGFFTLSGYLMSKIITEQYRMQSKGILRYLINRFLRIFPPYWCALLCAFSVVHYFPEQAHLIHPLMVEPTTELTWIRHFTLFGLVNIGGMRLETLLVPPAWSLQVEYVYYLLLPFILFERHITAFFITISFCYPLIAQTSVFLAYYSPLAGSLPFCMGILIYRIHSQTTFRPPFWWLYVALSILVLLCIPTELILKIPLSIRIYISLLCNAVAITILAGLKTSGLPQYFMKLDKWCGNISYPIFLLHLPIAVFLYTTLPALALPHTSLLLIVCLIPLHLAAYLLNIGIERPINLLRAQIRNA